MDRHKATPKLGATARPDPGDMSPGRRFAYEMAFDPRFQGRRWPDVEAELRAEFPGWLTRHAAVPAETAAWDDVKGEVREAWESALDVEHAETDPWTGQWDERAAGYRSLWETRYATTPGRRWEDDEMGYRYVDAMAMDPRFGGHPWDDVAPGLEAGFPVWAASHGYRIGEGDSAWRRLRDAVRHAWENIKHPRGRSA